MMPRTWSIACRLVCLFWCAAIISSSPAPCQESQTRSGQLAGEMVILIERCLESGLPERFPGWLARKVQPHVVEDYDSGDWVYEGRGFFDYPLLKKHDRKLYKDVKRFWSHDKEKLLDMLPALVPLYKAEDDPTTRNIMAMAVDQIVDDAMFGRRDPLWGKVKVKDVSRAEGPVLSMLEHGSEDYGTTWILFRALSTLYMSSEACQLDRLATVLKMDMNRCEIIETEVALFVQRGVRLNRCGYVIDVALQLIAESKCEDEIRMPLIYAAGRACEDVDERFNPVVRRWLRDDLARGGGEVSSSIFVNYFAGKLGQAAEEKARMPLLIMGLDATHDRTRCLAIYYLAMLTGLEGEDLPYDYLAIFVVPTFNTEDENWSEERVNRFLEHDRIAVEFWKAWWEENKSKY